MTNNLQALDLDTLATVHGGNTPPPAQRPAPRREPTNRTVVHSNIGVRVPIAGRQIDVGVQTDVDATRSNYAACVDAVSSMTRDPRQIRIACGLPNGQP